MMMMMNLDMFDFSGNGVTPPAEYGRHARRELPGLTPGSMTLNGSFTRPTELQMPIYMEVCPDSLGDLPNVEVGHTVHVTRNGIELAFRVTQVDGPGKYWLWLLIDEYDTNETDSPNEDSTS